MRVPTLDCCVHTSMHVAGGVLLRQMFVGSGAQLQSGLLGAFVVASIGGLRAKVWDVFPRAGTFELPESPLPPVAATNEWSIAVAGNDGTLHIWDVRERAETRSFEVDQQPVKLLAISSDGRVAATSTDAKTVALWDAIRGGRLKTLSHDKEITAIHFLAGSTRLLTTAAHAPMATLWDLDTGSVLRTISTYTPSPGELHSNYTTPERIVAVAAVHGRLALFDGWHQIWDQTRRSQARPSPSKHHKGATLHPSLAIDFVSDHVSRRRREQVIAWQSTGHPPELAAHAGQQRGSPPASRRALHAGDDGFLRVWRQRDEPLKAMPHASSGAWGGMKRIASVAVSNDGRWAATAASTTGCGSGISMRAGKCDRSSRIARRSGRWPLRTTRWCPGRGTTPWRSGT